jgi:hypothetical protein
MLEMARGCPEKLGRDFSTLSRIGLLLAEKTRKQGEKG